MGYIELKTGDDNAMSLTLRKFVLGLGRKDRCHVTLFYLMCGVDRRGQVAKIKSE